jgi:DNA-directed RNA polymerase specialized sigma24 family protein
MIEWYAKALTQNPQAVRAFIVSITPLVQVRVARTLLRCRGASSVDIAQEVKDMVQEVMMALFAHDAKVLRAWQAERGLSLENFIGLVAERETLSMLRSGKRSAWRESTVEEGDVEEMMPHHTRTEETLVSGDLLRVLLEHMQMHTSPLGFSVFRMMFVEELSVADICETLSLTTDAVYAWRSRLVKQAKTLAVQLSEQAKGRVA